MFSVLQRLLCQEPLALHLNVQRLGDVGHEQVNELAHTEHDVLEYDDKGKLEGEDLPVDGGQDALVVSEAAVVTFLLEKLIKPC